MDKEKYQATVTTARQKRMQKVALTVLKEMLDKNVKFFDAHYIRNRSTEIVDKTINKLKFKSDAIEKARRAFLDVLSDGMELYSWEDEKASLKKDLKDKNKKADAKKGLKRIERLEKNLPLDTTDDRDIQCEPVCQFIAKQLLSKDNIIHEHIKDTIELENELLISVNAFSSVEDLFNILYDAIDKSYKLANEELWGCPREKITMQQLDNLLKKTR